MLKFKYAIGVAVLLPAFSLAQFSLAQNDPSTAVEAQSEPVVLSLKQAIQIALSPEGNALLAMAEQSVRLAEAQSAQARAGLRPDVEAGVSGQNQQLNLAALGFESIHIPVPGFNFPNSVGPFNTFDARVRVRQNLVDVSARRRSRAVASGVQVAQADTAEVRDRIAAQVAKNYIAALRAGSVVETAMANMTLAEALLQQAEDRQTNGKGLAIDVARARSGIALERQRALQAEIESSQTRLQLLRSLGASLDTRIEVRDPLAFAAMKTPELADALAAAFHNRPDLVAIERREDRGRLDEDAIRSERWPSLVGYADYGALGTTVPNSVATYTVGVAVKVPVFDGGRRQARRAEASALIRQDQLRERDLKAQVELEVRLALETIRLTGQQVVVAGEELSVARDQLAQARRRYEAGVTANLELVEAQARLARSTGNHTAALYASAEARVTLLQAMGKLQELVQ
jgi:outer membrane protein